MRVYAPFGVRMSPDQKMFVQSEALRNARSMNAQIIFWIQEKMHCTEMKKPQSGNSEVLNSNQNTIGRIYD